MVKTIDFMLFWSQLKLEILKCKKIVRNESLDGIIIIQKFSLKEYIIHSFLVWLTSYEFIFLIYFLIKSFSY